MILRRCLEFRSSILRKYLLKETSTNNVGGRIQEYSCFPFVCHSNILLRHASLTFPSHRPLVLQHRKWYSKGLNERDTTEFQKEKELTKVTEIFPEARVTLNIFSQRAPDKVFDVHYKQYLPGKKAIRNHEWTCTYKFFWPEKAKFESTAISKRVAAEKAALQALHWLYTNGRIDNKGQPIYDKKVIEEIKTNLNEPIHAEISEKAAERVQKIWSDYEIGIKEIYAKTAEQARLKAIEVPAQLTKDSTIDDEDEYPEENGSLDEQMAVLSENKGPIDPIYGRVLTPPSQQTLKRRSDALDRTFKYYNENITPLPIDEYADEITSTIQTNRVSVVVGAAGCGKSTRVPAALLRQCRLGAKILVSEPRRVAAIGLAERVADELGEEVGESIGYQVRLDSKPPRPPAGSVLYCTSGVLLNRLHGNPGLEGCTHVIIDEAHERDVNTDVSLLLLKRAMEVNPELKLVIMSATLDAKVFTEYFDSCPVIEVPGRTYPVEIFYLEDIQKKFNIQLPNTMANCKREDGRPQLNIPEIVEVIKAIDKHEREGAILVFLPGWAEIKHAKQLLDAYFAGSPLHLILPVHSRLSTADQSKMFTPARGGVRKIVVASNIAETAVTVPDAVCVVDAGAHRENKLTEGTGTASLETVWVSLAGAKQRCGRAGRVQPGQCYRLYTKEKEAEFVPYTTPEILRVPLEQIVLDCKTYAPEDKAQDFLSQLPQPPSPKSVKFAVKDLIDLGALSPSEAPLPLGRYLTPLPLPPRMAAFLIRAVTSCTTLAAANVAAVDSNGDAFLNAPDRREEIREIKRQFNKTSDHAALHRIQSEFEDELNSTNWKTVDKWCEKYGLNKERLGFVKSLSSLYLRELFKTGIMEPNIELDDINRFSDIDELIVATLFAGFDTLLITKRNVKTKGKLKTVNDVFTTTGDRAHIASESVNTNLNKIASKPTLLACYRGRHSIERRALMLYQTSVISPQAVMLFSMGPVEEIENDGETAVLSVLRHKLKIHVPASQSEILLKARQMLWGTFDYHINRDIKELRYDEVTAVARFKIRLLKAVCRILVEASDSHLKSKGSVEDFG